MRNPRHVSIFRSLAAAVVAVSISCSSSEPRADSGVQEETVLDLSENDAPAEEPRGAKEPYALRVNRTLLYPVKWGRAEDLAVTLAPLIESSYGPGTRVVAHPASNHLIIYLPPPAERRVAAPQGRAIDPRPAATAR